MTKEEAAMNLQDYRRQLDEIDDALIKLFLKRMNISAEIAHYKKRNNLPVFDPAREQQKLEDLTSKAGENRAAYITKLYSLIFELSRANQENIIKESAL